MSSPTTPEPRTETPSPGDSDPPTDEQLSPNAGGDTDGDTESGETAEESADDLSLDLVFEILKNSRRREVLRYLKDHRERVTLSELAEHVAAIENDTTVKALSSQQRKRVYVGLYQCHLPKLDDMDVVEFNQSRGHVELGPNATQLDKYLYLDAEESDDRPWYRYYLGVSAIGGIVLLGGAASGVLGGLGVLTLAILVVLAVCCLAVGQAVDQGAID